MEDMFHTLLWDMTKMWGDR